MSTGLEIHRRLAGNWYFLLGMLLLKAALDAAYVVYVQPNWAYMGFGLSVTGARYLEGWLIYALTVAALSPVLRRPSDAFVLILAIIVIAPMASLFGLTDESRSAMYMVFTGFWIVCLFRLGRPIRVPTVRHGVPLAIAVSAIATLAVLSWFIAAGGYRLLNFDITAVYDFRGAQDDVINKGVFPYLNVWVFKVFNVFLLAWALHRRLWTIAIAIIALQIFFFGVSNHKAVLLYPFVVLGIWFFFRRTKSLAVVPFVILALIVVSSLLWYSLDIGRLASLFVRRALFTIANNTFDYYEFFETHAYVYWSNSFLSPFFDYPYHLNPPQLIGEWRGNPGHVNNSFLSTGYMQAGFFGVILYCAIVGFLFRLIDSLSLQAGPIWFALAVTVVPMQHMLSSADLPTALLSHGIGVNVLLLFLARRRRIKKLSLRRPATFRSDTIHSVGVVQSGSA